MLEEAKVVKEAFDSVLRRWSKRLIEDIVIGMNLGYVEIEGGAIGLFYTHAWENPGDLDQLLPKSSVSYAYRVLANPMSTLLSRAAAWGVVAAATTAAIDEGMVKVDVMDVVEVVNLERGSRVALIGYIAGLAAELRDRGYEVYVFDRNPVVRDWSLRVLPDTWFKGLALHLGFDAVIVTGSALHHPLCIKDIIDAAKDASYKVIVGPSASIHPFIAHKLGLTHVCGTYVPRDTRPVVKRLVKQGVSYKSLVKFIVKWCIEAKASG